jgi:hypothetical protein
MILCQLVCVNYLFNKGITITFTDKRDKDGNFVSEIFHSDEGLKNIFVI